MKKFLTIIILFLGIFILVGCEEEEVIVDDIKPLIFIESNSNIVYINQNTTENIDDLLLEGVSAIDNIDGNITDKIIVDSRDLDINVPGEYQVYFYVLDSSNNQSDTKHKTVIVQPVYTILNPYKIYIDEIVGERPKPAPQTVFNGAWYHKVESSTDYWLGIEGTITLPEVEIKRYLDDKYNKDLMVDPNGKNLDNPSIYMGGHASSESDVGLSLKQVEYIRGGNKVISNGSYAFRPFWRYITTVDKDIGTYDLANGRRYAVSSANQAQTNMIGNWYFGDTQFYYLPGDKLRMILYSPRLNFMQLQIEVIEKSTLPSSIKIREDNGWEEPADFISPEFRSTGHGGTTLARYKRVNAIDQSGNEGKPIILTNSNVKEAIWESVYLYRKIENEMYRVPFNDRRSSSLSAPYDNNFTYSKINNLTGGQTIIIHPNYKKD